MRNPRLRITTRNIGFVRTNGDAYGFVDCFLDPGALVPAQHVGDRLGWQFLCALELRYASKPLPKRRFDVFWVHSIECHMAKSGLKTENSDNPKGRGRQRVNSDNPVGNRILLALGDKSRKWLAENSGLSDSTISDCIAKGIAKADAAAAIAKALSVSIDWLLTGAERQGSQLVSVDDADWVVVPEYDLREINDISKGPVVSETPFRRDWLQGNLGHSAGIWVTKMPTEYPALGLSEGDRVFARDVAEGEATDKALYIFRVDGTLTVARLNALAGTGFVNNPTNEEMIAFRHFGKGEGLFAPVARILGIPLMRI